MHTVNQMPPPARDQEETRPLTLNWVIPEPWKGAGGHFGIFRIIRYLSDFGYHQRVYVVPHEWAQHTDEAGIARFIEEHFFPLGADIHRWNGITHDSDALLATHWRTAYLVYEADTRAHKFYFVQDFEPYFVPMSAEYLEAEHTYRLGMTAITLGPWLTNLLRDRYDAEADYFDFPVDTAIYYPRALPKPTRPRVVFYARPSTPRRAFSLGVEALARVHRLRPDVEIVFFGADDLSAYAVPFPYVNRGVLPVDQLAELYSSATVGLVLSLTNCSFAPREMMACRCAVVDLSVETTQGVMQDRVNAMLADPTPQSIADAVLELLYDEHLRDRLVETAFREVQSLTWERAARQVEAILLRNLPDAAGRPLQPGRLIGQRDAAPAAPQSRELLREIERQIARLKERREVERATIWHELDTRIRGERRRKAWLATARNLLATLFRFRPQVIAGGRMRRPTGELVAGRTMGQTFVAQHHNLHRIDLLISTYHRLNSGEVVFHLRRDPEDQTDIATVAVPALELEDTKYHSFVFPPVPTSQGRQFYFFLEAPGSARGDAITLWRYDTGEGRYENGRPVPGELAYRAVSLEEEPVPVPPEHLVQPTPWWQLPLRALTVGRQRGLAGVRAEIRSYLHWRKTQ